MEEIFGIQSAGQDAANCKVTNVKSAAAPEQLSTDYVVTQTHIVCCPALRLSQEGEPNPESEPLDGSLY